MQVVMNIYLAKFYIINLFYQAKFLKYDYCLIIHY